MLLDRAPGLGGRGGLVWRAADTASGLARGLRRMLAAADTLPAGVLLAGLARTRRYHRREHRPPEVAGLLAYAEAQPWLLVTGAGRIGLAEPDPRPLRRLLLASDRAFLDVLAPRGPAGAASHRELCAAARAAGLGPTGVSQLVATSPVLVRLGRDRYALRR